MFCSQCGAEISATDTFCAQCGASVEEIGDFPRICPKCGSEVGSEDTFCSQCGSAVPLDNQPATSMLDPYATSGEAPTGLIGSEAFTGEAPTGLIGSEAFTGEAPTGLIGSRAMSGEAPTTMIDPYLRTQAPATTGELSAVPEEAWYDEDESATSAIESVPCVLQNIRSGDVIVLDTFPFIIGKGDNVNCCIEDNDAISDAHIQIDLSQGLFRVTDLHSKNGTTVNGIPLNPREGEVVIPGSLICIANEEFRFERADQIEDVSESGIVGSKGEEIRTAELLELLEMDFPEYGALAEVIDGGLSVTSLLLATYDRDDSEEKGRFRALCDDLIQVLAL